MSCYLLLVVMLHAQLTPEERVGGPLLHGRGVTPWGGSQTLGAARLRGRRRAIRKLHLV